MSPRPVDFTPTVQGWTRARGARTWHLAVRYPDGRGGGLTRAPCGAYIDPLVPKPVPVIPLGPGDACRRCGSAAATFPKETS